MLENTGENFRRFAPPSQRNRGLPRRKSGDQKHHAGAPMLPAIPVDGCSNSKAARLLSDRWTAAMQSHNDPATDLLDRPVMYAGVGGPAWGQIKLPHQVDFLAELRRAYLNSTSLQRPDNFD